MGDDRPSRAGGGAQSGERDRLAYGRALRRHVDDGGRIPAGDGHLTRGGGGAPAIVGHRQRRYVDARARVTVRQHAAAAGRPVAERPLVGHDRSRRRRSTGVEDDRSTCDRESRRHVEGGRRHGSRLHADGPRLRSCALERIRDRQPDRIGARNIEEVRHGLSGGVRPVAEAPPEPGHEAAGVVYARRGAVPPVPRGVTVGRAEQRGLAGGRGARRKGEARRDPELGNDAPGRNQSDHHGSSERVRVVLRPRRHPNRHGGAGVGLAGRIHRHARRRIRETGAAVRAGGDRAGGERAEVLELVRGHDLERQRELRHRPRALVAREHRHDRAGRPVEGQHVGHGGELQRQRELGRTEERLRQRPLLHARRGCKQAGGQGGGLGSAPRPDPRRPRRGPVRPSGDVPPGDPGRGPGRISLSSRQNALRCGPSPTPRRPSGRARRNRSPPSHSGSRLRRRGQGRGAEPRAWPTRARE